MRVGLDVGGSKTEGMPGPVALDDASSRGCAASRGGVRMPWWPSTILGSSHSYLGAQLVRLHRVPRRASRLSASAFRRRSRPERCGSSTPSTWASRRSISAIPSRCGAGGGRARVDNDVRAAALGAAVLRAGSGSIAYLNLWDGHRGGHR